MSVPPELLDDLVGFMRSSDSLSEEKKSELKAALMHNINVAGSLPESTPKVLDLSNLNRYELIRALWENAKVASFFFVPEASVVSVPKGPTDEEIDQQMRRGSIDYLNGRAIKTNFSDMSKIDPSGYDSRSYPGAFLKAVSSLRQKE